MIEHSFVCKTCGVQCVRKASPSRLKNSPPTFCSNACKFKAREKPWSSFICEQCGAAFLRYVAPSSPIQRPRFCSTSCQTKFACHARGMEEMKDVEFTCAHCGGKFVKHVSKRRSYKFCSKTCSARYHGPTNNGYEAYMRRWTVRYGEERARKMLEEHRIRRSAATRAKNLGRVCSASTRAKIAASCTGIENALKGKTFVEFYGGERAEELAHVHSERLKDGFASGRLRPTFPRGKVTIHEPTGTRLRSQLELDAVLVLEARGSTLGVNLTYEPSEHRIVWFDAAGVRHVYVPDLWDARTGVLYEVKPSWIVRRCRSGNLLSKERAAIEHCRTCGIKFRYLTDDVIQRMSSS